MSEQRDTDPIPTTLSEIRSVLRGRLRTFLPPGEAGLVDVSKRAGEVVLRADLAKLDKRDISFVLTDDALSFERPSFKFSIALARFSCVQRLRGALMVVRFHERAARSADAVPSEPADVQHAVRRVIDATQQAGRRVFATRALKAVADLAMTVPESSLAAAAAASSDYSVLVRALETPAVVQDLRERDPLVPARLRGITARKQLLEAGGGTLSVAEVADLLDLSRQGVDKRRRSGRLIGVTLGRRGYAYPVWQFAGHGTLRGLESVLEELRDRDPWMQTAFLLNPNDRLNSARPIDVLKAGRVGDVVAAAQSYLEHGAA